MFSVRFRALRTTNNQYNIAFSRIHYSPDEECLSGYFSSQIQEGITNLTCPSGDCDEPISQRDIEIHVDDEDFSRFDRLQFQRTGSSDYDN